MKLTALTKQDCELTRQWRNQNIVAYRTPFMMTKEMQEDFYQNVVCNRKSDHRYWAVYEDIEIEVKINNGELKKTNGLIGMVGLTDISLENRNAELSIVLDPDIQGKGYGRKALLLLLDQGFNYINLDNIFGECYGSNPSIDFWKEMCKELNENYYIMPQRKFWAGQYYDAIYFNFKRANFNKYMEERRDDASTDIK